MRVTDSTIYAQIRAGLGARREQLQQAQESAISGRRVVNNSDDPSVIARARAASAQESRATGQQRAVNVGLAALQIADAALDQIGEAFTRARELALEAANSTVPDSDRANMASEVNSLRDQVLALANSRSGDHSVFAGLKDSSSAFAPDGTYNGDSEPQQIQIGNGLRISTGVPGDRVFGGAPGTQDAFATLSDLSSALASNDVDGVRSALDQISTVFNQIQAGRADLGGHMDTAQVALSASQRAHDNAVQTKSALLDIDPLSAYSDLQRLNGALEAAVSVAAQLPPPGLASRARI